MQIEKNRFYFIKDIYFKIIKDAEILQNKKNGNKRPCYYCFKDEKDNNILWMIPISSKVEKYQKIYNQKLEKHKKVDNIVFAYVEGEKRAFLIQNMFPITKKYIIEKYVRQNSDVVINKKKEIEIYKKANKILKLVEKGYTNLVFPDIISIKEKLLKLEEKNDE
ncbi:MAG: type III toxin-antitoxin system CptIN family toxin [Clostridia bacterium]